jgi:SPP1 family predicted phage head-tail adaptor
VNPLTGLKIGGLDRKITIQQKTVSRTALGDETEAWGTLASVWAKVIPMSGREYFNGQSVQRTSSKFSRFQIRYLASVSQDTQLRVLYQGLTYDIQNIAEIGRKAGLELTGEALGQT